MTQDTINTFEQFMNTASELIRMNDIRDAPEYAILGFALGFGVTSGIILGLQYAGITL